MSLLAREPEERPADAATVAERFADVAAWLRVERNVGDVASAAGDEASASARRRAPPAATTLAPTRRRRSRPPTCSRCGRELGAGRGPGPALKSAVRQADHTGEAAGLPSHGRGRCRSQLIDGSALPSPATPGTAFRAEVFPLVRGLYTAAAGALVAQSAVDTIANNLANVNTARVERDAAASSVQPLRDVYRAQTDPAARPGRPVGGVATLALRRKARQRRAGVRHARDLRARCDRGDRQRPRRGPPGRGFFAIRGRQRRPALHPRRLVRARRDGF